MQIWLLPDPFSFVIIMEHEDQWIDGSMAKVDLDLCDDKAYQTSPSPDAWDTLPWFLNTDQVVGPCEDALENLLKLSPVTPFLCRALINSADLGQLGPVKRCCLEAVCIGITGCTSPLICFHEGIMPQPMRTRIPLGELARKL